MPTVKARKEKVDGHIIYQSDSLAKNEPAVCLTEVALYPQPPPQTVLTVSPTRDPSRQSDALVRVDHQVQVGLESSTPPTSFPS